ncbi:MAG: DUF58 domain-containing protein [Pseudomonadota bacterium]
MKPTVRVVWLAIGLCLVGLLAAWLPRVDLLWWLLSGLLILLLFGDAVLVNQRSNFEIDRAVDSNLPIGRWQEVTLKIRNRNSTPVLMRLFDHVPPHFEVEALPREVQLAPEQWAAVVYRVRAMRRGDARFPGCELMITSPLGLLERRHFVDEFSDVRVYPDFASVIRYSLLAVDNRLAQIGVRSRRRRGEGSDFFQLRDYREGEAFRQVDWNATAKRQKLISREYRDERDQRVIFLVDCGRRMRHVDANLAHFDQALNAILLMGYVASRQGDAVGFMAFAGEDKWVKPQKGTNTVTRLLNQCYDLESTMEAPDYTAVAQRLLRLQRRRSLVIFVTNLRAEAETEMTRAVSLLSNHHHVVLADLREPGVVDTLSKPMSQLDDALGFHVVMDYLNRRQSVHRQLRHHGAVCVDTVAAELPLRLVNQYLEMKRSGVF